MNDKDSALDKIKKLLRMQNGGTDSEVATAMRMARELSERHNIDLATVDYSESELLTRITHKALRVSKKGSDDETYAHNIIKGFFHVDCIWQTHFSPMEMDMVQDLVIVGTAVDIEISEYVFEFLTGHFKRSWRRRPKRIRNRRSFVYGIYLGILSKLREGLPESNGTSALAPSRRAYIQKHWPRVKTTESKTPKLSQAAANIGYGVGRNTNIRQGINAEPRPAGPPALPFTPQLSLL